jgi:SAM-dependent methyltransferase
MIGTVMQELGKALRERLRSNDRRPPAPAAVPEAQAADVPRRDASELRFDWQVLGDPESQLYGGGPSPATLDLLVAEPKFVLDVGCSVGDFGVLTKQRFPNAKVWGLEPNQRASGLASPRLDRVLTGTLETVDWRREGVAPGEIDTVFLMDVLEHLYDPWRTLLLLRNLLGQKAQLLVSIPNVRNVLLIQDLASGYWRYRRLGLLDITHIRFFTRNDMERMFYQTGFRVLRSASTQCPGSRQIFEAHRDGGFPKTIALGCASLTIESPAELADVCAVQHVFVLQPARPEELSADERALIDGPHPATVAFSGG